MILHAAIQLRSDLRLLFGDAQPKLGGAEQMLDDWKRFAVQLCALCLSFFGRFAWLLGFAAVVCSSGCLLLILEELNRRSLGKCVLEVGFGFARWLVASLASLACCRILHCVVQHNDALLSTLTLGNLHKRATNGSARPSRRA